MTQRPWFATYRECDIPVEINPDAYRSVVHMLERAMTVHAEKPAFRSFGQTLTYAEVDRQSRNFASYLQMKLGVSKGDRIAVMMPNLLAFPIAFLGIIRAGGVQVQPGEFSKLLLVIFLAGYLREKRELLAMAHRRVLGIGLPAARHLGPLLVMTGVALGVVAVMNDMGTALLLYGIFLAMVYVATGRRVYTVAGLILFAVGSWAVYHVTPHVQERFTVWLDPWKTPQTGGYQIIQSIESIADGGIFGSGLGQSFQVFDNGSSVIPAAQTDGIYAVWANETGLAGAAGLLLIYLLFAYRGFKIASLADDGFSKLLATGLTFAVTLQAFLIVGGITRLIPLTGITLPFMSYGGSSILANFMLLALLLMVSAKTRRART